MKPVIIFVDDEPNILQAIRRFTRNRRNVWDMHFFENAFDAMAFATGHSVDVIVSDMRMPELNGADLVETISKIWPGIIRIILSGAAEQAETYRSVGRSHRFLAKPCDPDELITTLDNILALRDGLGQLPNLRDLAVFDCLQSPPEVYVKLNELFTLSNTTHGEVLDVIKNDPNLAVRTLQLANSSYFGRPLKTYSVSKALEHIGVNALRNLMELKRLGNTEFDENANPLSDFQGNDVINFANKAAKLRPENSDFAFAIALFAMMGTVIAKSQDIKASQCPAYMAYLFGMPTELVETLLDLRNFSDQIPEPLRLAEILEAISPRERIAI